MPSPPLVVVIAGPNGAGKSTAAPRLLRGALAVSEFVNADTIARGLSAFQPELVALSAGRLMLMRLRALAATRVSFAFETTLAGRNFAPWLDGLRDEGYHVHIAFLSLPSAELAVARVAGRVRQGGHSVPEEVIRRRFVSGIRSFFGVYQPVADSWQLFDNADARALHLVAARSPGLPEDVHDAAAWQHLMEV